MEIYVDTIGPTWRGVKLILQQARHSPTVLEPTREAFRLTVDRARSANHGTDPIDASLFDYSGTASVLYRMLVPKLNLDCPPSSGTRLRTAGSNSGAS